MARLFALLFPGPEWQWAYNEFRMQWVVVRRVT